MLLLLLLAIVAPFAAVAAAPVYPSVTPATPLRFPADHGAHPGFRTEWWYVTGWLKTADGKPLGFQVTFFRSRPPVDAANPSRFAPKQILFAHAALSDPAVGKLAHAQRIARSGFGLAEAKVGSMAIVLDDWSLVRRADGRMVTRVAGDGFALDLELQPTQPVLLQGQAGYSQKGPDPLEASHYYSLPHLQVTGTLTRKGIPQAVTGTAWMDREWSSSLLNPRAIGWDWLGLNMDNGGALTLFRVRDAAGGAVWAGGSYRSATGRLTVLKPGDVRWTGGKTWRSARTGARYPVAPVVQVRLDARWRRVPVTPLFADQELDSRSGGGPVYWEGAVTVPGGRGYLEMTGYQAALKM